MKMTTFTVHNKKRVKVYEFITTFLNLFLSFLTMQVGDVIDAMDLSMGAWFEANIVKITRASDEKKEVTTEEKVEEEDENKENQQKEAEENNNNNNTDIKEDVKSDKLKDAPPQVNGSDTDIKKAETTPQIIENGHAETESKVLSGNDDDAMVSSNGLDAKDDGLVYQLEYEG